MKVIVIAVFFCVASAQSVYYPEATYETEYRAQPYSFSWEVNDAASDNNYAHTEVSDGKVVSGSYRVALPDGRMQIVTYKDDSYGYVADVKYEGEAKYPEYRQPYSAPAYKAQAYQTPAPAYQTPIAPTYQVPIKPAYEAPTTPAYEAPAPIYRAPAPTYKTPVYEATTPSYKAPTPVYKAPTPVYKAPTPVYKAPTPVYKTPTPVYKAPTPVYKAPIVPAYKPAISKPYDAQSSPSYKIPEYIVPSYRPVTTVAPVYTPPSTPSSAIYSSPAPLPLLYRTPAKQATYSAI
ncbi:uncharacterized protein LOC130703697 [Daphnia carinata]|uniref:uncharacterized protein LOC130703697 n=1 Tax=Daphnia carinata TaxID=120202 RepID=UPI00257982C5|nr:uncharacterized protein LOC130703697 [Daphnia carinata]